MIEKVVSGTDQVGDFAAKYNASVDKIPILISIAGNKIRLTFFDTSISETIDIPYPVKDGKNGLTKVGQDIYLGGLLISPTTINTGSQNFLIQSGTTAQRLRISNVLTELAGALELRIAPPSIDAATASVGQILKLLDEATGECDYGIIDGTDFALLTPLSVVNNKVRLTFKDGSFIESAELGGFRKTVNTAVNYAVSSTDQMVVATVNPLTITLPLAPVDQREIVFKAITASGGSPVTINGNGKLIDAAATATLTSNYASRTLVYNAALNKWLNI